MDFNTYVFTFAIDLTKGGQKVDAGLSVLFGHGVGRRNEGIDFNQCVDFTQNFDGTVGQAAQLFGGCVNSYEIMVAGKDCARIGNDYGRNDPCRIVDNLYRPVLAAGPMATPDKNGAKIEHGQGQAYEKSNGRKTYDSATKIKKIG